MYTAAFTVVWIGFVLSFYFFGTAFQNGSPEPTATQTEPLKNNGKTVYVTPIERRVNSIQFACVGGILLVVVGGGILHFVAGVKVFKNNRNPTN